MALAVLILVLLLLLLLPMLVCAAAVRQAKGCQLQQLGRGRQLPHVFA